MEGKDKVSFDDLARKQKQIEYCYLTLRFAQKVRKEVMACYKKCRGSLKYPFRIDADAL